MAESRVILPGATLGVLGGGQLGRMFAQAAARLGYRVRVFTDDADGPAMQVVHEVTVTRWGDEDGARAFARGCDAITLEWENVPVRVVEVAAESTVVRPGAEVLAIAQDRLRERAFLEAHGLPCAAHAAVRSAADLPEARRRVPGRAVLKSARFGYDGRGQLRLEAPEDGAAAFASLGGEAALLEAWVSYQCELSVLVARSVGGEIEAFGPILNDHRDHILDCSTVPAEVPERVRQDAVELARAVATSIGLVGLICVEMFLTTGDELLVNELAPRTHNSGHLTIEACRVSQFEQQVRAVCGLPLAPMRLTRAAAMVNLLGDLWSGGEPAWARVLSRPEVSLHLYGKAEARPGRKMGHLTVLADTPAEAAKLAREARALLASS